MLKPHKRLKPCVVYIPLPPETDNISTQDLHFVWFLQVLYYGFNFGVEYRYAVPLHDTKKEKDEKKHRLLHEASYGWVHGGWGECNVHCGGGKH